MVSPGPAVPPYVADIRAQPSTLEQLLRTEIASEARDVLASLRTFDRVVLTGMGSSLHGIYPTFLRLAAAGLPVWWEDTAELLGYQQGLTTGRTLLWVTSQSGESAEVIELLDQLPTADRPSVLAMTNDLDSTLANAATTVLPLCSGDEQTVGTRSYVNTLALGALATAAALGEPADPELWAAPERLAHYLAKWDDHVALIGAAVPESPTFILGRGTSLASARTAALITKEAARSPVEGMSVPQFRHGPLEMAGPQVCALLLAGGDADQPRNAQMRTDLLATGAQCVWIDADPPHQPSIRMPRLTSRDTRPLGEIIPLQLLTVVLATRLGEEPGRFRQIDKITRTL